MVSVMASEAQVAPFIDGYDDVTIGVINGPTSVVISGGDAHVAEAAAQLNDAGYKTRQLEIPVAAHSPMLDPVLDAFEQAVRDTHLSAPQLSVVSSMTGQIVTNDLTEPSYWRQHLRSTVRFADSIQTLYELGCSIFIEAGPQDTLLNIAQKCLGEQSFVSLPSLSPSQSDWQRLLMSMGQLYTLGYQIDWDTLNKGYAISQNMLSATMSRFKQEGQSQGAESLLPVYTGRSHSLLNISAKNPPSLNCFGTKI